MRPEKMTTNQKVPTALHKRLSQSLFIAGVVLILAGIAVVTTATAYSNGNTSYSIIIFVGPIPITITGGTQAALLTALATALTILGIISFLLISRARQDRTQ